MTTDQTAQSLRLSRLTFPDFETDRSRRPSSMPAPVIQALIPCLTQMGMATVRTRRPLPSRSARTHLPSRCWMKVVHSGLFCERNNEVEYWCHAALNSRTGTPYFSALSAFSLQIHCTEIADICS